MSIQCKTCGRKAVDGYAIYRTSPFGEEFEGECREHYRKPIPENDVAGIIEDDNRKRGTIK